jgi:hypothetical protein
VETVCVEVRLKPASVARARAWAEELSRRAEEVLATLRDEGVAVESVFLDERSDGDFLIYYMKAGSLDQAAAVVQRSTHDIDVYHQQFKDETWESRRSLELLVDFENFPEK